MLRTKYLLIGIWNTGIAFIVFIILQSYFVPPLSNIESILGTYAISLPNSYLMQRNFVWNSKGQVTGEFAKFFVVSFSQLLLNLVLIKIATERLALPVIPSQIFVVGVIFMISFVVMKRWTFTPISHLDDKFQYIRFGPKGKVDGD